VDGRADGGNDREYSRAPEIEDLVELCRSLNAAGARYVLIGGFAVILHGYVRATKDIDLLVDASTANIRAVKSALSSLPDNAASLMADDEVGRYGYGIRGRSCRKSTSGQMPTKPVIIG
jgi:hypothetical protein